MEVLGAHKRKKRRWNDWDFVNNLGGQYIVSGNFNEKDILLDDENDNLTRKKRGTGNDTTDTSGTDPGSTDVSLNESDIPLINLKPRQKQDLNLLPKQRPNLRSKSTVWYRPMPTVEDFEMDEIITSTPKKTKTTTVPADPQIPGPSRQLNESDLIYNKSTSSSSSNISTPNKSTKPLLFPKAKFIPKKTTTVIPRTPTTGIKGRTNVSGAVAGAGSNYQGIFETQLGTAASHPDNPLTQWFHEQFYGKKPTIDDNWQNHYGELLAFDELTEKLRISYHSSSSWYERQQIMRKLNNLRDTWRNKYDNPKYQQAFDQHWQTYNEHFEYSDNELREQITRG